jgi:hypothetical protein
VSLKKANADYVRHKTWTLKHRETKCVHVFSHIKSKIPPPADVIAETTCISEATFYLKTK